MKRFLLTALLIIAFTAADSLVCSAVYYPQIKTYLVAEDAGVDGSSPDRRDLNYGKSGHVSLRVRGVRYPYFKFDLADIKQYSEHLSIRSVTLQVTTIGAVSNGAPMSSELRTRVYHVEDDSWTEGDGNGDPLPGEPASAGLTFNNMPEQGTAISDAVVLPPGTTSVDMKFDITEAVINEIASGDTVFSCMLDYDAYYTQTVVIYTKENGANKGARLIVEYDEKPEIEIADAKFSKAGSDIAALTNGTIECLAEAKNFSDNAISPVVSFGLYYYNDEQDALELKDLRFINDKSILPAGMQTYTAVFHVGEDADKYYIKIWAFDDFLNLNPYNSCVVFDQSGKQNIVAPVSYLSGNETPALKDVALNIDRDSGVMTAGGIVESTRNKPVTVLACDFNAALESVNADDVIFIDIVYPSGDGSFSVDFLNNEQVNSKKYTLYVKSREAGGVAQIPFQFYKNIVVETFLNSMNTTTDPDELLNTVEEYLAFTEMTLADFDWPLADKQSIAADFIAQRGGSAFSSIEEAIFAFRKAIALYSLAYYADLLNMEYVDTLLTRYRDMYELPLDIWTLYTDLEGSADGKENALKRFCNLISSDSVNISPSFVSSVIVQHAVDASNYTTLRHYIEERFNQYIILSGRAQELFGKIKIGSDVYKLMMDDIKNVKTTGDISDLFEVSCGQIYNRELEAAKGGQPNSIGGRGGTVRSSYKLEPVAATDVNEENAKTDILFEDVSKDDWYYEAVKFLKGKSVVSGNENNFFEPGKNITRAEFVKMIFIAAALKESEQNTEFKDVGKNDWYYTYINGAVKNGIISGYGNGYIGANDNIKRQDMAMILYRVLSTYPVTNHNVSNTPDFRDTHLISDYALEAVDFLVGKNIFRGNEKNEFLPNDFASKAEAAKVIFELMKIINQ